MTETISLTPANTAESIERIQKYLARYEQMNLSGDIHGIADADGEILYLKAGDIWLLSNVWKSSQWSGVRASIAIALAVHDGVEGGKMGVTDGDTLRLLADYLDKLDDLTDEGFIEADNEHRASRDMQADLRRIAERLDASESS